MAETLNAAHDAAASVTHKGFTFLDNDLNPRYRSFAEVCKESRRMGARLQALGISKGDRLALVLSAPEDFVLSFLGTISAGAMPVPLYPPLALTRLDNYIERAAGILRVSGARALLTSRELIPVLSPLLSRAPTLKSILGIDSLYGMPFDLALKETEAHPEEPCFLQFTSGSTSAPRGVIVTHRNLMANAKAIIDSLEVDPDHDSAVSWLPLYHDMGLIGFVIASLVAQVPVVFIPSIAFVKHPWIWMETVHKYRATVTFGPNFAFDLAARRAPKNSQALLDLSSLRILGCGAEPINPRTMDYFLSAFAQCKLREDALMPCYGMAEATLAIAFNRRGWTGRKLVIDRHVYETQNVARVLGDEANTGDPRTRFELVSCGWTFDGHEIRIFDEDGKPLPDGHVGEIVFKGPSVTPGYFENPEATRQLLKDGWLHTGDLGFILQGELYITGRQKDIVIINGRNYPPQAIEWVVEEIAGIRKGSVVAFSIDGDATEKLIVIAETTMTDNAALAQAVSEQIRSALGLSVDKVVLVARGSVPKTSSGKLQRRHTKALFEEGLLGPSGAQPDDTTGENLALG